MTMREPPSSASGSGQPNVPPSTSSSAGSGPGGPQSTRPGGPNTTPQSNQSGVGAVKEQIGEHVGPAADQVQEKAGQAFGQVRRQVTSQLDSQKEKAAEGLTQAADAVRQTSQQLRKNEQTGMVADYADDAAQTIERFAHFLNERDMGQLARDAEQFARQRPTMFLASAFTLGLVAARFLKSSPPQPQGMNTGYGQSPYQLSRPSYTPAPVRPTTPPTTTTSTPPMSTGTGGTGMGTSGTGMGSTGGMGTPPRPSAPQSPPNTGPSTPPSRGS